MTERSLHADLRTSLLSNDAFNYAHLIKFERPSITDGVEGLPHSFTYLTDAAYNISYDDGTKTPAGADIPAQTYIANKVLTIGSISESIVPKIGSMSLTLDSSTLGTAVAISATINATAKTIVTDVDLSLFYQEGDKVIITGAGGNNNLSFIIKLFGASNTVTYTDVTDLAGAGALVNASSVSYASSIASEELITLLQAKDATYTGYLNRRVTIYRAHINPETGAIIGEPYLFFKGLISKGDIKEDVNKSSSIKWTLTSHWGDFQRVGGRYTNDDAHRALDELGNPDISAALRPEYAADRGFAHAETAINLNSTYTTFETRSYYREDQSVWGGGTGANVEYQEPVQRQVELSFNLSAKYLPVVYGVQKVKGNPIFVDTNASDSSKVTLVHALCEGPIGGVLDVHVDGNPFLCVDQADKELRGVSALQTDSEREGKTCYGRADLGGTLLGYPSRSDSIAYNSLNPATVVNTNGGNSEMVISSDDFDEEITFAEDFTLPGAGALADSANTFGNKVDVKNEFASWTHEEYWTSTHPITMTLQLHTGKPFQRANTDLVAKSAGRNFHVQKYAERPDLYWTQDHRLLDTAYVVGDYTIAAGETTIPELEYVVQGRPVECHHYDGIFNTKEDTQVAAKINIFNVGDTVQIKGTDYTQTVIITDRTRNQFGAIAFLTYDLPTDIYSYKFSAELTLVDTGGDTVTDFFMERTVAKATDAAASAGSNNRTIPVASTSGLQVGMVVTSATDASNITSNSKIASIIAGVSITLDKNIAENIGSGDTINFTSTWGLATRADLSQTGAVPNRLGATLDYTNGATGTDGTNRGIKLGVTSASTGFNTLTQEVSVTFTKGLINSRTVGRRISAIRGSSDALLDNVNIESLASSLGYTHVFCTDALYLGSGTYTVVPGDIITVKTPNRHVFGARMLKQERRVKAYNSTSKVVLVDEPFATSLLPKSGDTWEIISSSSDSVISDTRQSINPALHLLDYLTNERFGAGLDIDTEIDLASFKASALKCDDKGTIKVASTSAPTVGHVYTYPDTNDSYTSGDLIWRGTVSSVSSAKTVAGLTLFEVEFKDTYGELVTRMTEFSPVKPNKLMYSTGDIYPRGTIVKATGNTVSVVPVDSRESTENDALVGDTVIVYDVGTADFTCHGAANNTLGTSFVFANASEATTANLVVTYEADGESAGVAIEHTAFELISGQEYIIVKNKGIATGAPAANFTQAGAANNNIGTVFTANATTCDGTGEVVRTSLCKSASGTLKVGSKYRVVKAGVSIGGAVDTTFIAAATSFTGAGLVVSDGVGKIQKGTTDGIFTVKTVDIYREGTSSSIALNTGRAANGGAIKDSLLGHAANPIVKSLNSAGNRFSDSGYTLYDATQVKYWKLLGWAEPVQSNATRHQCNQVIDTSKPIFNNITSMLSQFNGMLKYSNGKYVLDVKAKHGSATAAEQLNEDDIIGSITVKDSGQKGKFNSISANIIDPQLKFGSRQVTFSNSTYLKEDRGVPKKGNYSSPSITNYFNARYNIKQKLDESRSSFVVSFTIGPKGLLLIPGSIIELTYPRFKWSSKLLRITDLKMSEEGNVSVTASEHDDDAYLIPESKETLMRTIKAPSASDLVTPPAITNFAVTATRGGSVLTWTLPESFDPIKQNVQVLKSASNSVTTASVIAEVKTDTYTDSVLNTADQTVHYWAQIASPVVQPSKNNSIAAIIKTGPATGNAVTGTGTTANIKADRAPGTFVFRVSALTDADTSAEIEALFNGSNAPLPTGAIQGDVVSFYTGTQATPTGAAAFERGSSTWAPLTTVTAAAGVFGTLVADNFAANTITVGKLSGDVNEEYTLDVDLLNKSITGTQQATTILQEFSLPAPTGGVAKKSKIDIAVRFKVTTTSAAQNVFTNFTLERNSKGAVDAASGVVNIGNAAANGTVEATLVEQIKIAGNVLAQLQTGSISDTVNGSSWQGAVRGAWYDLGDNQTYILFTQPGGTSGNLVASGEAIYFSADSFVAAGTFVAASSVFDGGLQTFVQTTVQPTKLASYNVKAVLGSTTTATEFRLKAFNGATHSSGVTAVAQRISGSMEHIV